MLSVVANLRRLVIADAGQSTTATRRAVYDAACDLINLAYDETIEDVAAEVRGTR